VSVVKAKKNYLGLDGNRRMNCALSIMSAFRESHSLPEEEIISVGRCSGGTAPGGLCGAYYAATFVLKGQTEVLEKQFREKAGSLKCREIRAGKRLSCLECVEQCARIIEECSDEMSKRELQYKGI